MPPYRNPPAIDLQSPPLPGTYSIDAFVPDPAQPCFLPNGTSVPCADPAVVPAAHMRGANTGHRDLVTEDRVQHGFPLD